MQSVNSLSDPFFDSYPAWKKELILRRRANARTGGDAVASSQFVPANLRSVQGTATTNSSSIQGLAHQQLSGNCSVNGPKNRSVQGCRKQLAQRSLSGPSILHYLSHSADTRISFASTSAVRGSVGATPLTSQDNESVHVCLSGKVSGVNMHHKGLHDPKYFGSNDENCSMNNGDEDLQYGPGIVSKLKNRYLSLAMRESKARPALRRFSSLEDLLDAEDTVGAGDSKTTATTRGRMALPSSKRDAMKRARSVDCLTAARRGGMDEVIRKSRSPGDALSCFSRDDVIIIENPTRIAQEQKLRSKGTPTLDVVTEEKPLKLRNIKSVFEPNGQQYSRPRPVGVSTSAPKPSTPTGSKPRPKAKPAGLTARRPDSIQEAKGSLKQVTSLASPTANTVNGESPKFPVPTKMSFASSSKETLASQPLSPTALGPLLRNENSIESTRVLLENRKNAQKSRRESFDDMSKVLDLVTPKPVLLVETSPTVNTSNHTVRPPGIPPALPIRTVSSPTSTVLPFLAPRLTPTSPTISPSSPPVFTPIRQQNPLLASLVPSLTSTPNQSPSAGHYTNGFTPSLPSTPLSVKASPSKQKAPAPQPQQNNSSTFKSDIISKALPSQPVPTGAKTESLPHPGHQPRPTARPPSPPLYSKNVPLKPSTPTITSSPILAPSLPFDSNCSTPSKTPSSLKVTSLGAVVTPSPILNTRQPDVMVTASSHTTTDAPATSHDVVTPSPILRFTAKTPSTTTVPSSSSPVVSSPSRAAQKSGYDSSPVRTTKVTTFSSTGDEITEVIEAVNTVNRGNKASKDRWHQEQTNSLVFNFVGKKVETPDYIENDGVDISKKINKVSLSIQVVFSINCFH